jgi:hypothetical protein
MILINQKLTTISVSVAGNAKRRENFAGQPMLRHANTTPPERRCDHTSMAVGLSI